MQAIFEILALICDKQIIMAIPLLILVGYFLKHYWPSFPNKAIPEVEALAGMIIGIVYAVTSNEKPIAVAIIKYGAQGIVVGALSVLVYDIFHNALPKREKPSEENMEEKTKKFVPLEHPSIVYAIAIIGSAIISGAIEAIFNGFDSALFYMLNYVHYGILTCLALDIILKLTNDRKLLVWQYWVLTGLVLAADVLYVAASVTTTFFWMWFFLVLCFTILIGAGIWSKKVYEPSKAKRKGQVLDFTRTELETLGVPASVIPSVEEFLFR